MSSRSGILNTVLFQRITQVFETARMISLVLVEDFKHLLTARRQEEVVEADCVLHDGEHQLAVVGVEDVARRQVDPVRIVQRTT